MDNLNLEIITPGRIVFSEEVESVTIPGTKGNFQILRNHAPLISIFEIGVVKVQTGKETLHFATGGGSVEVLNNKILVLADSLEKVEEINEARAESALSRARQRLSDKGKTIDRLRAEAALARAMNRIKLVSKFKTV